MIHSIKFEIITVCKQSCGEVVFLHLSISHSVHRRVSATIHTGIHTPCWADTPAPFGRHPQVDIPLSSHPFGIDTPEQTATVTDGTHPTEMLSCLGSIII